MLCSPLDRPSSDRRQCEDLQTEYNGKTCTFLQLLIHSLIHLEPDSWRFLYTFNRHLVSYQRPDIADTVPAMKRISIRIDHFQRVGATVPNHSRTLKTNTPSVDVHILREAHWLQHLGTEHATIPYFDPFAQ